MKTIKNIKFIKGLSDYFEDESLFPPEQTHMVILDNIFQASIHSDVVDIFTQHKHHKNVSDAESVLSR